MHPRMILAMARKDALDIWLDRSKLFSLLSPLLIGGLWLLISHLASSGQPTPTTLLVYNPRQSPLPQFVSSTLTSAQITEAPSPAQVSAAFAANGAYAYDVGLIIPADFEQQLRAGGQPHVTLYLNGATLDAQKRATLQGVVLYYARTVATPRPPLELAQALGVELAFVGKNRFDYLVEVDSEETLLTLKPDLNFLERVPGRGVIVTSRSSSPAYDFVSRFFAPRAGINEDRPCYRLIALHPGALLGRTTGQTRDDRVSSLSARGHAARGVHGKRISIGGQAVTMLRGELLA